MYCVNCGVKLADTEQVCPLCGVTAYHPDIVRNKEDSLYPRHRYPVQQPDSKAAQVVVTTLFLLPILITLLCDLQINGAVSWSGFVAGALLVAYVILVLPFWFQNPNPVIFVPCSFAAVGLYLLYINWHVDGNWFLPFAFPLVGGLCVIFTTLITLLRYLKRGKFYIFGGCTLGLGLFMPLIEFLAILTFDQPPVAWSVYPFVTLVLLGGYLIFLGICRPARESMERKFFL